MWFWANVLGNSWIERNFTTHCFWLQDCTFVFTALEIAEYEDKLTPEYKTKYEAMVCLSSRHKALTLLVLPVWVDVVRTFNFYCAEFSDCKLILRLSRYKFKNKVALVLPCEFRPSVLCVNHWLLCGTVDEGHPARGGVKERGCEIGQGDWEDQERQGIPSPGFCIPIYGQLLNFQNIGSWVAFDNFFIFSLILCVFSLVWILTIVLLHLKNTHFPVCVLQILEMYCPESR